MLEFKNGCVNGEMDGLLVKICPSPGVLVTPACVSFTKERTKSMIVAKDVLPDACGTLNVG